jgi:uncharacterized membrane protein
MSKRILKQLLSYFLVFGIGYFLTGMILSTFKKKAVVVSNNSGIFNVKNDLW